MESTKMAHLILLIILLYIFFCLALPPVIGRKSSLDETTIGLSGDTSGAEEWIRCVDENDEALEWRLRLIASARERIILSTHYFYADESGREVMAALLGAADRGVSVRILIDGINGGYPLWFSPSFRTLYSHPNVELRLYNPFHRSLLWRVNYRMHDKYLIADSHAYLLGGRNTGNLFLGNYQQRQNHDREVLVCEANPQVYSSLTQVEQYFEAIWNEPCCRPVKGRKRLKRPGDKQIIASFGTQAGKFFSESAENWISQMVPAESIRLLANPISHGNKEPVLWERLCSRMEQGKKVLIQSPYIICNRRMHGDIRSLCAQGITVQYLTNSVTNGANAFGCADYLRQREQILSTGVQIYEFAGEHSLHTKTVLIDDQVSIIGSFNVDMRSAYLDTELMLEIHSPELNGQLRAAADKSIPFCRKAGQGGMSEEGSLYHPQDLRPGKQCFYWFLRFITRPFRYLL